ncbi:MAG: ABC transporter permease [Gammaproteobacteria bacterium]|nr:ABC transporter permease [Gammaproteobacteria bacterium]OYY23313.1 MAG: ABC transporter permease [Thiotrichales bacterium 35-46-9]OYZ06083.1 MAG: ABC transporter permease [Thiotrichales bacterium 16-46-22]OZA96688.1 MAG: ABC transporter permease [Thiotrichales bacterium 34-46-19]UCG18118.1 MAG: ABC transporter permease [Thiotrichales bacterium]
MAQPSLTVSTERSGQLNFVGDWTLEHYHLLKQQLNILVEHQNLISAETEIDLTGLTRLDTVGCQLLIDHIGEDHWQAWLAQPNDRIAEARRQLLLTVMAALKEDGSVATPRQSSLLADSLASIGQKFSELSAHSLQLIAFIGLSLSVLLRVLYQPKRWRITSFFAHLEQTGFNALPIVALLTFLIGAVVAFLGATLLTKFGANIYTVHLVAFSFLREFGPLLAAIIIAGRTASAFTAQIGSMRSHEEIDAIRVLGLNAIELLVIPRLLALLVALPILTFVAMMSGILGGMLVAQATLDISSTMFLSVLQQNVGLHHFWVGMAKAPFFAFIIVMISCLEGFKVSGSAQSVGEHTTASVVQSIFMVIVIDAIFAVVCMEMGW